MSLHLLKGTDNINNIKLIDITNDINVNEPFYITELKIKIIDNILIPISNDDLDLVLKKAYLISFYKDKINEFISIYDSNFDLLTYKYILDTVTYAITYHNIIVVNRRNNIGDSQFGKARKDLGIIQIRAEYILYDQIIGKPKFKQNEKYNILIVNDIKMLLNRLNVDFYNIRSFILEKYK